MWDVSFVIIKDVDVSKCSPLDVDLAKKIFLASKNFSQQFLAFQICSLILVFKNLRQFKTASLVPNSIYPPSQQSYRLKLRPEAFTFFLKHGHVEFQFGFRREIDLYVTDQLSVMWPLALLHGVRPACLAHRRV